MLLFLKELICHSNSRSRILKNYGRKGMQICSAAAEDLKILRGIKTLILQMKKHLSKHLNLLKLDCRICLSNRAYLGSAPHCKLPLILRHPPPETHPTAPTCPALPRTPPSPPSPHRLTRGRAAVRPLPCRPPSPLPRPSPAPHARRSCARAPSLCSETFFSPLAVYPAPGEAAAQRAGKVAAAGLMERSPRRVAATPAAPRRPWATSRDRRHSASAPSPPPAPTAWSRRRCPQRGGNLARTGRWMGGISREFAGERVGLPGPIPLAVEAEQRRRCRHSHLYPHPP